MPSALTWLASLMCVAQLVTSQSVDFFYTDTAELCSFKQATLDAGSIETHGGICAYRQDVARIYACPAPDATCWNFAEKCNSGSNLGQTVCNRAGTVWCCNAVAGETCTTTQNQINVCISNFTSPNSGVSVADAQKKYLSAVGVSNVTATAQNADPTPFSTRQLAATASPSSRSSSASQSTSATTSGNPTSSTTQTTSGSAAAQSSSGNNATAVAKDAGISGGAIAGIVVGVIVALGIIGGVVFFVMRKKRSSAQSEPESLHSTTPQQPPVKSAYAGASEKKHGDYYAPPTAPSELGSEGHGRVEMPVSGYNAQPPQTRYEMA